MSEQHFDETDPEREVSNPLQIGLIDLFAVTTLVAMILAMAVPVVRTMPAENRWPLIAVFGSQAIIVALVMLWEAKRRKKLLEVSGHRIGVGYCGDLNWRHWPLAKSLLILLFFAMLQLCIAVAVTADGQRTLFDPGFLFQQIQLGFFFGMGCSRYLWRVFPNSMEFFDNGISLQGTSLIPWNRVSVRNSQFFPDRIVVIIRVAVGSIEADTNVVQVSNRLRSTIFSRSASASILEDQQKVGLS
jgi:hypothetical protein